MIDKPVIWPQRIWYVIAPPEHPIIRPLDRPSHHAIDRSPGGSSDCKSYGSGGSAEYE